MLGLGYRREMADWDLAAVGCDFFEVAPENWLQRSRAPLHRLLALDRPVWLHGVSLNLGGTAPIDATFVRAVGALMRELGCTHYSDHLAASGDAHQLYDLFPIAFTEAEVRRVSERIARVQDLLGMRLAVENSTWYTNVGEMDEADFLGAVLQRADCRLLLDLNNVQVNHKNHGGCDPQTFVTRLDLQRVSYLHVAGHEFDPRFGLYIDTHSQPVDRGLAALARQLQDSHGLALLLEWDNDVPGPDVIHRELACLRPISLTM